MKLIKLFSVVAISAITLNAFATKTAEARIKVIAPTYKTSSSVLLTEDDAVAADFSTNNNGPLGAAPTNSWAVQAWLQNGETKYAGVENKSISNLKFCFKANANETAYKITFSQVTGTIVLKSADTTYTVIENDTLDVTCTAGATYEFIINPAAPTYTRTVTAGQWGTICYPKQITAVTGGTLYYLTGADESKVYGETITLPTTAGGAYVFKAEAAATELVMTYTGDDATQPAEAFGLGGTFVDTTVPAGKYGIMGSYVVEVKEGNALLANRAYIDVEELRDEPAPSRGRAIFMINNTPTGMELIEAPAMKEGKMILNGRMVIVKDGKMFNAQGAAL